MDKEKIEPFMARVIFKYLQQGENEGRVISYVYSRQALNELVIIKQDSYDNSQFLEIGNELMLEGKKCVIKNINFKLEDHTHKMTNSTGDIYDVELPLNFNCTIHVFVDWI
jgi:hypothetical protein